MCSLTAPPTSQFYGSPPILTSPYSLRHSSIEIRPVINPRVASKCSSERKSHTSFTLNQKPETGTSLVVQWLRVLYSNAGNVCSIPGQGLRSHMLCGAAKIILNEENALFIYFKNLFILLKKTKQQQKIQSQKLLILGRKAYGKLR